MSTNKEVYKKAKAGDGFIKLTDINVLNVFSLVWSYYFGRSFQKPMLFI